MTEETMSEFDARRNKIKIKYTDPSGKIRGVFIEHDEWGIVTYTTKSVTHYKGWHILKVLEELMFTKGFSIRTGGISLNEAQV